MPTILLDIPQDIAETFDDVDELRRTLYEDFIIEQRQQGKISLGKAAELLGITYREFFALLGKKGCRLSMRLQKNCNKVILILRRP